MSKSELPFLSTTELSRLIESKQISPVEITEAYLDRIDDLDFKFNSYLTVCRREAIQAAEQAEKAIAQGNYLGPMHGIPVAVKDQLWSKGIRSTGGSRILADSIPDEDATAIANMKRAGAILLGKTNLSEFAIDIPQRFSTPRNPWDLDRLAGTSSTGSGVATSAFLCATSLGEDTGGSVRFPASWSGVVGLQPTWGRVSRYGLMPGVWSMDTVGPISRTVEDAAITLGAIAGYDSKDAYTWDVPVPDYRKALNGSIKGMRVGVMVEELSSDAVEPEVREAVTKAISVLAELGASVEDVSIPLTKHGLVITWVMLAVEASLKHRDWVKERLHEYSHSNQIGLLTGSIIPAQAYYKAQKLRSLLRQQMLEALDKYDVLVSPTTGTPALPIEQAGPIENERSMRGLNYLLTFMFNLAGATAISVPCGFTSQGLPIGFQIGSRPGGEETILKVAHAYEQSTDWHKMRPPTV